MGFSAGAGVGISSGSAGGALGSGFRTLSGSPLGGGGGLHNISNKKKENSNLHQTYISILLSITIGFSVAVSVTFLLGASIGGISTVGDATTGLAAPSVGEVIDFFLSLSLLDALAFGKGGLLISDFLVSWEIPVTAMLTGRGCRGEGRWRNVTELVTLLVLC